MQRNTTEEKIQFRKTIKLTAELSMETKGAGDHLSMALARLEPEIE